MKKFLSLTLALLMLMSTFSVVSLTAYAEETKASYSMKLIDKRKTYSTPSGKKFKVNVYYKKVVLKGNTDAIKKINATIKKDCRALLYSETSKAFYQEAKYYTKSDARYRDCYDSKVRSNYATSEVTYNKNGIISIMVKTYYNAGGVGNSDIYGMTFDLNTGKLLKLTDVCSASKTDIKGRILLKATNDKDVEKDGIKLIKKTDASKFDYYIDGNKAVVCFGPYEITYGGWYRTYTIKR